jgi:hypothetical protein
MPMTKQAMTTVRTAHLPANADAQRVRWGRSRSRDDPRPKLTRVRVVAPITGAVTLAGRGACDLTAPGRV